jgi:hypothetical protein
VERAACLAGTKEYWNQISSSELEENVNMCLIFMKKARVGVRYVEG